MEVIIRWLLPVLVKKDWILVKLISLFVLMQVPHQYVLFKEWEGQEESEMDVLLCWLLKARKNRLA